MNKKRFKLIEPLGTRLGLKDIFIKDTQEDYYYNTKESVVDLLNRLSKEKRELENKLKIYEHELNCCDGLYASDNEEFEDYFRLDFSNIISKW